MTPPADDTASTPSGLERIVFFSDAVMAIAITLLVLDIRVPDAAGAPAAEIGRQVAALWPKYLGYFVSFSVIGLYWVAHLRCFRYIRRYDRRLVYLNFLFLMFIAFMPFPTSLLFATSPGTTAVQLYAGTAAGMGLSLAALWTYAVWHKSVSGAVTRELIRDIRLHLVLPAVIFVISMVVAAWNPNVATYLWLLLIPVYAVLRYTEVGVLGDEVG